MTVPLLHMICGAVGAGKTTYALALSKRLGGVHLSIDQWMMTLFGKVLPQPALARWDWIVERVHRCEAQMARMAVQCARLGVPAILDQAFLCTADRARLATIAGAEGLSVQLHFFDVPADAPWRWVKPAMRNRARPSPSRSRAGHSNSSKASGSRPRLQRWLRFVASMLAAKAGSRSIDLRSLPSRHLSSA